MGRDYDEIAQLIGNERRRFLLLAVAQEQEIDRLDLVNKIAAWENNKDPDDVIRHERQRVRVALYPDQANHLGMLEDAGLIRYDEDEDVIRATMRTHDVVKYIKRGYRRFGGVICTPFGDTVDEPGLLKRIWWRFFHG